MVDNTMDNTREIQAIESNMKRNQLLVDQGNALERLRSNKDFKKVILDSYFEQEAIRLVQLKADPSMQKEENQAAIIKQMDAIGALAQYFNTVFQFAQMAKKNLASDEEMRDELLAEGLE